MNPDPLHVDEDDPLPVERDKALTVYAFGAIVLIVLVASCVAFR